MVSPQVLSYLLYFLPLLSPNIFFFVPAISINFNDIGTSAIVLPRNMEEKARPMVIHVDVRLSASDENGYLIITIWKASVRSQNSILCIRNETDAVLFFKQSGVDSTNNDFTLVAPPYTTVPFGWTQLVNSEAEGE